MQDKKEPTAQSAISGGGVPQSDTPGYRQQQRRKTAAALLSVTSSFTLLLLKIAVGVATGSVGVLSEALHSAIDLVAAVIALLSVRASATPPDEDHPYGHGKIESLSGLAEALLITVAAGFIIYEAVHRLTTHRGDSPPPVAAGLIVMALSALINFLLSSHLRRVARETDSLALDAEGRHLRTDIATSIGVFIGLLLTGITRRTWFDPATALIISLLILSAAYSLVRDALSPLLDARLPPEEEAAIQEVLEADIRVLGYHKLRTRKSGAQRYADVHVQMDDDYTLVDAHNFTEELEDRLRAALPALNISIHIEPFHSEMRHQQDVHGIVLPQTLADQIAPHPNFFDAPPAPTSEAAADLAQDDAIVLEQTTASDRSNADSIPTDSASVPRSGPS